MPRSTTFSSLLLTTISIAALTACSSGGSNENKTAAPMPPISEIDTAMNQPVPPVSTLDASDTVTPTLPSAAATTADADDRIAKLEQSVNALRADYDRIMPAFASLNTTNARIQTLLGEIEKDTGKLPAATAAAAPIATPAATTTTVTTITKPGTVSSPTPLTSSVTTTTTAEAPTLSAPPLSSFKAQPTPEEARAEAQRQMAATKPASLPETKIELKIAPAAGVSTGANSVKAVRIGEHGSKTRLVLDLSANAKPEFKYDLDNGEKVLLVELPASGWSAAQAGTPKSPLIESWTVQKTPEGGSTLAIQLKKDARVLSTEFLKPEGPDSARLVMDIASAS